jgi:Bacterial HORMA domain family 1
MTETYTDTFNREDIRRVHASFAADYRIAAESTQLLSDSRVSSNIASVKTLAEDQYLDSVHMRLLDSDGRVREAAVYRVSTGASGWSSDRPGDVYWTANSGDELRLVVFYNDNWDALTEAQRDAFREKHLKGWGPSDFDGRYDGMAGSTDRQYASRAYGMDRTRYSGSG